MTGHKEMHLHFCHIAILLFLFQLPAKAQEPFSFAVLTDSHVSDTSSSAAQSLLSCIEDINRTGCVDFVIHCGDLTNFGLDEEELVVKSMLEKLDVPFYAVPGNHESTWSESGCSSFSRIYGAERFCFEHKGWRFVGCPSGPDVRMSPGLISCESIRFIEGLDRYDKTIVVNHYPVDDGLSNYAAFLDLAASKGACFFIGGHIHINEVRDYSGIPGILCRTSQSATKQDRGPGYNIVTVDGGHISVRERSITSDGGKFVDGTPWFDAPVSIPASFAPVPQPRMGLTSYDVFDSVREVWTKSDDADIASGFALDGNCDRAFYGNTAGDVKCISLADGSTLWTTHLGGKIFSTPALKGKVLVTACTDGGIYALDARNGSIKWVKNLSKAVLASPVIFRGKVYIGASDNCFRCLRLRNGKTVWENTEIVGHVITRALVDRDQVVFGSWGRKLYSLDPRDGRKQWEWTHPKESPMYSPAACWCVKSGGRIFVSIPDRMLWAFDAASGKPLWKVEGAREAVGLSEDGRRVFTKSMFSSLVCSDVNAPEEADAGIIKPMWEVETPLGRDISPTEIVTFGGLVLLPSDKGNLFAFDEEDGSVKFGYRFSVALVNPVSHFPDGRGGWKVLMSAMDGRIALIDIRM